MNVRINERWERYYINCFYDAEKSWKTSVIDNDLYCHARIHFVEAAAMVSTAETSEWTYLALKVDLGWFHTEFLSISASKAFKKTYSVFNFCTFRTKISLWKNNGSDCTCHCHKSNGKESSPGSIRSAVLFWLYRPYSRSAVCITAIHIHRRWRYGALENQKMK